MILLRLVLPTSNGLVVPNTCNCLPGLIVPTPTKPPSLTVRTSVVPSNKFTISAVPLCIPTIAVSVLLFAPILTRSTPIKFVSSG